MTDREPPSIHIPRDLADSEDVPDDLDSAALGPYEFPSPKRRRLSAWVYLTGGAMAAAGAATGLPVGMWIIAVAFLVLAAWHLLTAWPLAVSDSEALEKAARAVNPNLKILRISVKTGEGLEGWYDWLRARVGRD